MSKNSIWDVFFDFQNIYAKEILEVRQYIFFNVESTILLLVLLYGLNK